LTTARVAQLVEDASSEVCGYLVAAGVDVTALAADTSSGAYKLIQRVIVRQSIPLVLLAISGNPDQIEAAEERAATTLKRLLDNPALLGYDDPVGQTPCARTTTDDYSTLSATNAAVAREWGITPTSGPIPW